MSVFEIISIRLNMSIFPLSIWPMKQINRFKQDLKKNVSVYFCSQNLEAPSDTAALAHSLQPCAPVC